VKRIGIGPKRALHFGVRCSGAAKGLSQTSNLDETLSPGVQLVKAQISLLQDPE
jgi:hypothetical protein